MERQIILRLVEGDTGPDLPVRFTGLDLRNYSSIVMHIEYENLRKRFSRTVTPDSTDHELGSVAWQQGDLIEGEHKAEFSFVNGLDSKISTLPQKYPIILDVRRDIG